MRKRLISILVVEDLPNIANLIKWTILKEFNRELQVLVAMKFEDAKEIIEQDLAEIYIIDFELPDGHGEDLIKMIRDKSNLPPIIAETVNNNINYQLDIFKKYDRIKYVTKDVLIKELPRCLLWAKNEVANTLSYRMAITGRKFQDSINLYEICYVERIVGASRLHVELYNFETRSYYVKEIRNIALHKLISEYNPLGNLLRCHNSYIINKKMVEKVSKSDSEILMLHRGEHEREVKIPIGSTYKKAVLYELKGLY